MTLREFTGWEYGNFRDWPGLQIDYAVWDFERWLTSKHWYDGPHVEAPTWAAKRLRALYLPPLGQLIPPSISCSSGMLS